ncbi:MAG: hypothetical protein IKC53_00890, partial [Lentisphaeria bacterium]|nr:hypothetical protein [Lentisphaeria bacterium]
MEKSYYSTFFAENNLFSGIFPFFVIKTAEKPKKERHAPEFFSCRSMPSASRSDQPERRGEINGSGFRSRLAEGRRVLVVLFLVEIA